jgi:hypothetical protein
MRKLPIALLAVALLAGYYILGTGYLEQRQEQAALASDIDAARQALALVPDRPADLDRRLEEALAGKEAAETSFPERLNTTQVLNGILRLAEDHGVKAIPLVTQPWTTETAGGQEQSVFRLDLTVTGDFARVEAFVASLETGVPETLVVEHLRAARSEGPPAEGTPVEAGVSVAVYARPEDRP